MYKIVTVLDNDYYIRTYGVSLFAKRYPLPGKQKWSRMKHKKTPKRLHVSVYEAINEDVDTVSHFVRVALC